MSDEALQHIHRLLQECTTDEEMALLTHLRGRHPIHQLEADLNASAEVILEAIYRAPDLTRWMLRGVVADAAFGRLVIPSLEPRWRDVTPAGNFAFDYAVEDAGGVVTVQVKLQRSKLRDGPIITTGGNYGGLAAGMYLAELQRTRTGSRGSQRPEGEGGDVQQSAKTRPYRFGEFDVLAVSLYPSTDDWGRFRYTVGAWLLPAVAHPENIATYQPVSRSTNNDWTDDFDTVVRWLRSHQARRIAGGAVARQISLGSVGQE